MNAYDIALDMKALLDQGVSMASAISKYLDAGVPLEIVQKAYSIVLDDPLIGIMQAEPFKAPGVVIYE
jgi:hypothetical protein